MQRLNKLLQRYLSCCVNCGSFLPQDGRLCRACKNALQVLINSKIEKSSPYLILSLYHWAPAQSFLLSRLIHQLKGDHVQIFWEAYAKVFLQQHQSATEGWSRIYLVPAPSTKRGRNHALYLSEEFAKLTGALVVPCLRKVRAETQKLADRGDRSLIEFEIIEKNTPGLKCDRKTLWVFVDDVVTSGATARAAHIALGKPENFVVWTLARRSLSCGGPKTLL